MLTRKQIANLNNLKKANKSPLCPICRYRCSHSEKGVSCNHCGFEGTLYAGYELKALLDFEADFERVSMQGRSPKSEEHRRKIGEAEIKHWEKVHSGEIERKGFDNWFVKEYGMTPTEYWELMDYVMYLDNYTCKIEEIGGTCKYKGQQKIGGKSDISLIVHHIDGNENNNELSNLLTVHTGCHLSFHNKGNKFNEGRKWTPEQREGRMAYLESEKGKKQLSEAGKKGAKKSHTVRRERRNKGEKY